MLKRAVVNSIDGLPRVEVIANSILALWGDEEEQKLTGKEHLLQLVLRRLRNAKVTYMMLYNNNTLSTLGTTCRLPYELLQLIQKEMRAERKKTNASNMKVVTKRPDFELSTGIPSLDLLLSGKLKRGCIVELYGPSGSMKTQTCMKICAHNILSNSVDLIVFVESGNCGLSVSRMRQLGLTGETTLAKIKHTRCHNLSDLFQILQSIEEIMEARTLIILDCITPMIWACFGEATSNDLLKQLQTLLEHLSKNACVIMTNNSIKDIDRQSYKRALGKKLNVASTIVQLSKGSQSPSEHETGTATKSVDPTFRLV